MKNLMKKKLFSLFVKGVIIYFFYKSRKIAVYEYTVNSFICCQVYDPIYF
jgi:hypothetical protein